MAIGLGRMLGFRFLENFDYPYVSRSATELWRRWNVSLSSWFRDYVYLPLGGRSGAWWRADANLLLVFLLTGVWHGAGWNFVLFGLWFGAVLVLERRLLLGALERTWRPVAHAWVLLVWLVGCVLFRAESLAQIDGMLGAMVGLGSGAGVEYHTGLYLTPRLGVALVVGALAACPIVPWWRERRATFRTSYAVATVAAVAALLLASLATLAAGAHTPFLYFRF
jgi:alginate O-acetyltransferase complex protein AlgI